jgi:hypothetical protein
LSGAAPATWIGEVRGSPPSETGARFRDLGEQRAGLTGYEHSF